MPDPLISITATPSSGIKPLTVEFTATPISGEWSSYHWDFGDGYTSTDQRPSHVYTTDGYHTVSLIAYGTGGAQTEVVKRAYIRVGVFSFSVEYDRMGALPISASFSNTSVAPTGYEFIDWRWDFGDVSIGSGLTGPSHVYSEYGSYNVTLSAKMTQVD